MFRAKGGDYSDEWDEMAIFFLLLEAREHVYKSPVKSELILMTDFEDVETNLCGS
jgi:hypothetical protein